MKRLLIALFLLISSFILLAIASPVKRKDCNQDLCCQKNCNETSPKSPKTDYIFWEPIGKLMMIPQ